MKSEESIDNHRVVHGSAALLQNCESLVVRQFRSIRTIRGQRVKTINDRENSSPDRDCCCFDAGWIAGSIPVFMMVTNDGNHWVREIDRGKDVSSDAGVELHFLELSVGQLAWLVQDVFG